MKKLVGLLRNERAVASIEYAFLGALMACVIAFSVGNVGSAVGALYERVANCVQSATSGGAGQGC